ncbi:hypothetical protein [Phytoactinopolyspora halotolerans]|uniref:Uncharacterized protein n=1 Tax=Phytoactinopolyspora halotolerans TaxID=1981512 RepID=A0A6L9S4Y1_9ACTN|nr:hypothetical protein [Phytoactinopolyspora halotolerans]NEE00216.1 hypothetical protein [Phytoactinopolyspora halotolerans]
MTVRDVRATMWTAAMSAARATARAAVPAAVPSVVPAVVLAVLAVVLASCGGTSPDQDAAAASDPADRAGAMLDNLPSCDRVPMDEEPEVSTDAAGEFLPDGARVTSAREQGNLTSIEATVRMTPLDLRADYEGRTDIEILRIEDEVFETEVLARTAGRRMYLRATALCADGTALSAVLGPDSDDAGLPEFQSD